MSNKERGIFYIVSWMCVGLFAAMINLKNIEYIFSTYNTNFIATIIVCLAMGVVYLIPYIIVLGITFSWIINIVYIISYKRKGYEFVSYCFYPFIYIKTNEKKIKLIFNIIYLYEIGTMINLNNRVLSKNGIEKYIKDTKKVFRSLVYTHYSLIALGLIAAIFNFYLGGMIISFNITMMIYNSLRESNYFNDGYIYLSKDLRQDNLFNIISDSLKVSNNGNDFIYKFLQEELMEKKLSNKMICGLYENIMIESINSGIKHLNIEIEKMIREELARDATFYEYSFLNNYRIYRVYSIYVYKFYGEDDYNRIIRLMNLFYEESKEMPLVKDSKIFKRDKVILEKYEFNKLNLKEYFDICNLFDVYKKKINLEKIDI